MVHCDKMLVLLYSVGNNSNYLVDFSFITVLTNVLFGHLIQEIDTCEKPQGTHM